MKFEYIHYKNNMEFNDIKNLNKNLLQNNIEINNAFYSDIISKIK